MDVKICFEQVRVFQGPQNAEGVPISLVKWGWGGPHITRDMGTGVPISRGSPFHEGPHIALTPVMKLVSVDRALKELQNDNFFSRKLFSTGAVPSKIHFA